MEHHSLDFQSAFDMARAQDLADKQSLSYVNPSITHTASVQPVPLVSPTSEEEHPDNLVVAARQVLFLWI